MLLTFDLLLDRSRDEVWRAFDEPANLHKWQPTLRSFELHAGPPGQVGSVSRLLYEERGREIRMTETILERRKPELFAGRYDAPHAVTTVHNVFEDLEPGRTRWVVTCDFAFHGIWRALAPFLKGAVRKRLTDDLQRFKSLLESGQLS